jgi:streptomycin 6-kinase
MKKRNLTVSEPVRQKVVTLGAEGLRWLAGLDDLIKELEQEWQISVGLCLEGGSEAFVAQANTRDGSKAVLKVAMPQLNGNTVLAQEITALTLADGRGYVRLLRFDLPRRALLLEPLGSTLKSLGYSTSAQLKIICTILKQSWVQISPESSLPTATGVAQWLAEFITDLWEKLDGPCSRQSLDMALRFAEVRAKAYNLETAVLVHGDAHSGNTLKNLTGNAGTRPSFKLIDPDGIFAEPAYDLGILMREWLDELIADPLKVGCKRCVLLSHLTEIDPQAIWQWGFIQSISTGLLLIHVGQKQSGLRMLKVAEAWTQA